MRKAQSIVSPTYSNLIKLTSFAADDADGANSADGAEGKLRIGN